MNTYTVAVSPSLEAKVKTAIKLITNGYQECSCGEYYPLTEKECSACGETKWGVVRKSKCKKNPITFYINKEGEPCDLTITDNPQMKASDHVWKPPLEHSQLLQGMVDILEIMSAFKCESETSLKHARESHEVYQTRTEKLQPIDDNNDY